MSDVKYSKEHEWISVDGDVATIGITQHAAENSLATWCLSSCRLSARQWRLATRPPLWKASRLPVRSTRRCPAKLSK